MKKSNFLQVSGSLGPDNTITNRLSRLQKDREKPKERILPKYLNEIIIESHVILGN